MPVPVVFQLPSIVSPFTITSRVAVPSRLTPIHAEESRSRRPHPEQPSEHRHGRIPQPPLLSDQLLPDQRDEPRVVRAPLPDEPGGEQHGVATVRGGGEAELGLEEGGSGGDVVGEGAVQRTHQMRALLVGRPQPVQPPRECLLRARRLAHVRGLRRPFPQEPRREGDQVGREPIRRVRGELAEDGEAQDGRVGRGKVRGEERDRLARVRGMPPHEEPDGLDDGDQRIVVPLEPQPSAQKRQHPRGLVQKPRHPGDGSTPNGRIGIKGERDEQLTPRTNGSRPRTTHPARSTLRTDLT
ncbi:hypothetical protein Saa2_08944 [Streptomyces acidiscabies]|nr:hypothetical protein Saa2_08944 [Streptomyces acidiscabies]